MDFFFFFSFCNSFRISLVQISHPRPHPSTWPWRMETKIVNRSAVLHCTCKSLIKTGICDYSLHIRFHSNSRLIFLTNIDYGSSFPFVLGFLVLTVKTLLYIERGSLPFLPCNTRTNNSKRVLSTIPPSWIGYQLPDCEGALSFTGCAHCSHFGNNHTCSTHSVKVCLGWEKHAS